MRPKKTRKPFTLYLKKTQAGLVWYARFWDETSRRYAVARSTGIPAEGKRQRRYEAEQAAREILPRIQFHPSPEEKSFIQYLEQFWMPDSPYIREASLVKKRPLSAYYIHMNHEDVRRHIASFPLFQRISLRGLTPALIRDWLTWMAEKGLSGHRINHVLLGMRVAVRYAVMREELDRDPFRNISEAAETPKEKGILTPDEVARLIVAPVSDPRHRLAILLGALCGMRMGEVRGLQWGDIGNGLIRICHNWQNMEGLKNPKCKGGAVRENSRTVPLPSSTVAILETIRKQSPYTAPDSFILGSFQKEGEPVSKEFFRYALDKELSAIGIERGEQKRRNLSFHSLRHVFITLGRLAGISDLEIRAMAGHRSGAMTENYSHASQVLDFAVAREKLERVIGG
ncbi:MAG: site-specific integrase [Treponema sp.]|jgi:integrase|nr:site-specific integrase [Treponema sp.]